MCPRIHGRPFGPRSRGTPGRVWHCGTRNNRGIAIAALCVVRAAQWEVPSASVENNRSPGTVPLHSGRCDPPLLPFGVLLALHTFILPSGRGVEELERRRRGTRRPSWQGIGTQGSTGADEHLHTRPSIVFGKCNRPSLSRGSPPTVARQAFAKGAPSPSSLSARRGQHLASHAVSQGLCRPNTGAGEHPESPTRRRVAPPPPNRTPTPARAWPGLISPAARRRRGPKRAGSLHSSVSPGPRAGKRSSAGEFWTLGKGNAVWGPVFPGHLISG